MLDPANTNNFAFLQDELLNKLYDLLNSYLATAQITEITQVYEYSAAAHTGQLRKSGEAYICHPLSVAVILAEMKMDSHGIMAALLHDVIEDTAVTKDDLTTEFGSQVAELVDGVTKLTKIDSQSRAETQAENVRKMFLAMAVDLRVIIVKLADRLHNMQTLGVMPNSKKRRISKETMDIYIPIANRLGMNEIRHQLELLSFQAMYPKRYQVLKHAVKKARGHRGEIINKIENSIQHRLQEIDLNCKVMGREKHIPSIYQKMLRKKISFSAVYDVYAFRIFADNLDNCYRILGVVHNLYKPIPEKFKDYIALPKINGYQALHTILSGPYGVPIEIQIKTHHMYQMSESGIAAHWLYKDKTCDSSAKLQTYANEWLHDLLDMQSLSGNSLEFIENLKIDLFPHEIFVFTPQGKVIKLPSGSTIVDFAYAIHTDIGTHCNSARIDKHLVPLQSKLQNGMTIEVITTEWARPNVTWLNFVVTIKARTAVRNYLKNFQQQEAIHLGRRLLEKALLDMKLSLDTVPTARLEKLLTLMEFNNLDELLEDIGLGNKMPFLCAKRIQQNNLEAGLKLDDTYTDYKKTPLTIKGTEGMVIILAKCCRPIPGDIIIGYFNPGKGIVVHRHECRNHQNREGKNNHNTWLEIEWCPKANGDFYAGIRLEILNQRGTLATIASIISKMKSSIENVQIIEQDQKTSIDLITLSVKDRLHLANIMRKIKKLPIVLKITRIKA